MPLQTFIDSGFLVGNLSPNNIQKLNFIKLFNATISFSELSLLTVKLALQTVSLRELLVLGCWKLGGAGPI